jgi:hypothetical protein
MISQNFKLRKSISNVCQISHQKNKGYIKSFIFDDKLDGHTKVIVISDFGPSGVHALPLAAGINVGGHYKWHFFLFLLSFSPGSLLILPEGIVVGF